MLSVLGPAAKPVAAGDHLPAALRRQDAGAGAFAARVPRARRRAARPDRPVAPQGGSVAVLILSHRDIERHGSSILRAELTFGCRRGVPVRSLDTGKARGRLAFRVAGVDRRPEFVESLRSPAEALVRDAQVVADIGETGQLLAGRF